MAHRVLGREEWRGEIVQSVLDFDPQVRIRDECLREVATDVRRSRPAALPLTRPVPLAGISAAHHVRITRIEFELAAQVGIHRRGERTGHRRGLRIARRVFAEEIGQRPGEPRIESSRDKTAAALELRHELAQVDAQVSLEEIIL